MARPAVSAKLRAGVMSGEDARLRNELEDGLKGDGDKLLPPAYLTDAQKDVFAFVLEELAASGVLGNLDVYILANFAIAVDRLQEIDAAINRDGIAAASSLMSVKAAYTRDFFRGCNELCLSPQARAKVGSLAVAEKKKDPLRDALGLVE